jgi:tetratricopeptide (TPR) repeat protein
VGRIELLQSFIETSPNDPFPRYGLAMEYKNGGRADEAARVFEELIARFPDYVAAYLHAGNNLAALGRRDDALRTYRAGIEACVRKNDQHARGELEAALAAIDSDRE